MPTVPGRYSRTTERVFIAAVILTAVIAVGAPLYFFLGYVPSERNATIESLSRELAARTDQRQMGLERWVQDGFQDAATVAQYPSVRALLAERSARRRPAAAERAHVEELLTLFARTQQFGRVLLVSGRSGGIVSAGYGSRVLAPDERRLVRAAIETGVPAAGFHRHPVTPDAEVGFAVRVQDVGGRTTGAVLLEADPEEWIFPFLLSAQPLPQRSSEAVLVEQRGDSVTWVSPRRKSTAPPLTDRRLLARTRGLPLVDALRGVSRFGAYVDYHGDPVYASTRPIRGTPWGLVVKVDQEDVLGLFNARMQQEAAGWGTALLALLGLAGTLWWGARRAVASAVDRGLAHQGAALDQANDMVLFLGLDGRIKGANRRAEEFYAGKAGGLIGRHSFDLRPPEARAELPSLLANVLEGASLSFETVHVAAEGTPVPVEVSARRVHLNDGDQLVTIVRDIRERKDAEARIQRLNAELEARVTERTAQLEAANAEMEAFTYSVSHDLRAPLRAIDGYSRMLEEDHAGRLDDEGRRLLAVVRRSTNGMGELIDDLLAFSRAGGGDVRRSQVDMEALARSVWESLTTPAERQTVAFRLDPLPPAECDPALMRLVWTNLLSNALKFSGGKLERTVEVRFHQDAHRTTYVVKDNGVGFDPRYGHKLFGVFQRLHSAAEFEGHGVGLALVQRIVHRHGGEVSAVGAVGEGATFSFTLPREGVPG